MDMHMPVMDGLEATAKIVELDGRIPIVAMTANIMSNDREIYRKRGISDCVGKPFTSRELWRCLMKYLKPVSWQNTNETGRTQSENELIQKLKGNFVKDNQNIIRKIEGAISAGDITLAHRLVHTLKGNAGQLGKTLLQKAAGDVEQQLKDQKNPVAQQLAALEKELNAVLAEFASQLTAESAALTDEATQPMVLNAGSERELIEKVKTLLEMGNPECRDLIDNLGLIPGSEELIRQIEDLDFGPALATLAGLEKRLEQNQDE